MITAVLIAVALMLGYLVAVGLSMMAIFGLTKAAPGFVASDYRLNRSYKIAHESIWFVCVATGAYVSAWAGGQLAPPWFLGTMLAGAFVAVPWFNGWETRQRGLAHQLLLSLLSVAGVTAGFFLALRYT